MPIAAIESAYWFGSGYSWGIVSAWRSADWRM